MVRRLYHFTGPNYALDNLQKRRLRVSRFSECNDVFELAAFDLKDKALRSKHREWMKHMDENWGLVCFCKGWRNPLLWGHYASKHQGVCYGFDISTPMIDVKYTNERIYKGITKDNFYNYVNENNLGELVGTKFKSWEHEEEVRMLVDLKQADKEGPFYFISFAHDFKLAEVIIGPRSTMSAQDAQEASGELNVHCFETRPAFTKYAVTEQRNRDLWRS